jgi:hypothetical protein
MGNSPRNAVGKWYWQPGFAPTSNVTEMFLRRCLFDASGLSVVLGGIKNLQKFRYDGGDACVAYTQYEPKKVIEALVTHASETLEELVLDQEYLDEEVRLMVRRCSILELTKHHKENYDGPGPPAVSFRGFKKLKSLSCPWYMVRPVLPDGLSEIDEPLEQGFHREEDGHKELEDFDVRTILPESLEELALYGNFFDEDGRCDWQTTKRMFREPSPYTPHLTLAKTCIRSTWNDEARARIGTAEDPIDKYEHPLSLRLLDGHGFL